jgi:hypothetical protein
VVKIIAVVVGLVVVVATLWLQVPIRQTQRASVPPATAATVGVATPPAPHPWDEQLVREYNARLAAQEPTKASESPYNSNFRLATTSDGLTKADLAWHASNTFGWDCEEVIAKSDMTTGGYYEITCSNHTRLRVYPRAGQHPRITNSKGAYD